ncbi:hypothetical protein PHYPSEUDO_007858 [Phytophthora pseudosyringae]|uniref:Alpha/beta hydrolase n=1 Tax=Phytophthora pseudosyringae TaxID=221518 RepID=A0A8T1VG09_9STRA|nr:hypothetical protein PHYPSEUDO_007858 [Phytophthora pseudosyringae]
MSLGADNFYRSNNVTILPITFKNQYQMTIAANLFTPDNLDKSGKTPSIVVKHLFGAVKEQRANLYATKMAKKALSRSQWIRPSGVGAKVSHVAGPVPEVFSAAVHYVGLQNFVDQEQIGALGVCASGGFVISAAKIDSRIKAVATKAMYELGTILRHSLGNSQTVEQRKEMPQVHLNSARLRPQVVRFKRVLRFLPNFAWRVHSSRNNAEPYDARDTFQQREAHELLPLNDIDTISPRPLLFVSEDQSLFREFSEDAFNRAAEPKELYWVPGASHVDLYERVDLIPFATFANFFRESFANATTSSEAN